MHPGIDRCEDSEIVPHAHLKHVMETFDAIRKGTTVVPKENTRSKIGRAHV